MPVSDGSEVLDELRAALDIEVGVLGAREGVRELAEPVHIGIAERVQLRGRVAVFLKVGRRHQASKVLVVHHCHVHGGHCGVCIHVPGHVDRVGETGGVGYIHPGLALLAVLGCDDNDAVGALGTEHRRCGSILQHGDIRYLVGVDGSEIALYAIHQHERAVSVETGHAAHEDFSIVLTRLAAGLDGNHTGKFTGDGAGDVGYAGFNKRITLHRGYGPHDALFALGAVTDHDHLVEHGRIVAQGDVDYGLLAHGHLDIGVSHAGEDKDIPLPGLYGIAAVEIRDRAVRSLLDDDSGAGDGPEVIGHDSRYGFFALRKCIATGGDYSPGKQRYGA